jgi:hypothetical protein
MFVLGGGKFTTANILLNAWLANVGQIVLSMYYFNFNAIFTSMALTYEWNQMAKEQKGLRVSKPEGHQRGTYFLQLPYRFAVPLAAVSSLLHWLLSQTLFFVRIDVTDDQGIRLEDSSISACGFSRLSCLILILVLGLVLVVTLGIGSSKYEEKIPQAVSNSLMISAASHCSGSESGPSLEKIQWGVVDMGNTEGSKHCSFSSRAVTAPEVGKEYI